MKVEGKEGAVQTQEFQMGSWRQRVAEVSEEIACQPVNELGLFLREVIHHFGVSLSSLSMMLRRRGFLQVESGR